MRYSLVYGGLAGAIIIAVTLIVFFSGVTGIGHGSMLFGYLVMLVALSMIFVGVKRYRDVECGGVIRFGRAFLVGLGMAVFAALAYVVLFEAYLAATNYRLLADMVAGATGDERAMMEAQLNNPLVRVPFVFLEIFPVGLLIALVAAALLRNPRLLPATRSS